MKKTLLVLLAVMFSATMMADDIIVTKSSQRINAKIEEVGLDVVKYRRSDNLTGPLYTIEKKEIASIIYENGTVEAFQVHSSTNTLATQQTSLINNNYLVYSGGVWTKDHKYVDKSEYVKLLKNNCPAALSLYTHGVKCNKGGAAMLSMGIPIMIGLGVPLYVCSYDGYYLNYSMTAAGIAMMTIGGAFVATSIPLFCVGGSKKRQSVDIYNANCAPAITCDFTVGQNGVGLALNF